MRKYLDNKTVPNCDFIKTINFFKYFDAKLKVKALYGLLTIKPHRILQHDRSCLCSTTDVTG